jgi:hypothetical protein
MHMFLHPCTKGLRLVVTSSFFCAVVCASCLFVCFHATSSIRMVLESSLRFDSSIPQALVVDGLQVEVHRGGEEPEGTTTKHLQAAPTAGTR